ncbi:KxYKxGKxW signal peptide domain-containing protein, partial [Lactococcus nasutitermitis]
MKTPPHFSQKACFCSWKSGKHWLYATTALTVLAGASSLPFLSPKAKADTPTVETAP